MEAFFRTHSYLVEHVHAPVRRILMDEIDWNARLIGIKGTRGVGKTTFLLQYAKENFDTQDRQCLYVNMNNFYFQGRGIADFAGDFVKQGGRVLLSTDHYNAIDPTWAKRYLHASYYAAQATRSGRVVRPGHRPARIVMEPNELQLFSPAPQGLMPCNDGVRMASYEDMRCPAAVGHAHKTLVFGFPLEAVQDFESIYRKSVKWLLEP